MVSSPWATITKMNAPCPLKDRQMACLPQVCTPLSTEKQIWIDQKYLSCMPLDDILASVRLVLPWLRPNIRGRYFHMGGAYLWTKRNTICKLKRPTRITHPINYCWFSWVMCFAGGWCICSEADIRKHVQFPKIHRMKQSD